MPNTDQNIERLVEIYQAISQSGGISEAQLEAFQPELAELKEAIVRDLIWSPAMLIHIDDPVRLQEAMDAVEQLWDRISFDDVWDEMTYGGFIASLIGDYSDRAAALRPTFVSVKPETAGFGRYLTEATQCWLYGLNGAAVILCHSLLDTALYEAVGYDGSVLQLAKEAKAKGLISRKDREFIVGINGLRNDIVHHLDESLDSTYTRIALLWTRNIVEALLRHR